MLGAYNLTLVISGCAHDVRWMQHQEPVQSTIGTDPNKAPAGKVIPPPGMGVNLGLSTLIPLGDPRVTRSQWTGRTLAHSRSRAYDRVLGAEIRPRHPTDRISTR